MRRETTRTWAEVSLGNLEHNYRDLRACAPNSRFLGIVKANGYGHGAVPIAARLVELGAEYLAGSPPPSWSWGTPSRSWLPKWWTWT